VITLTWQGIEDPEEKFYVELDRLDSGLLQMTLTDPDDTITWVLLDEEVDDLINALTEIRDHVSE
jgi:hypothetical protein